jgi:nucleoside-diphosphate-sugar epimerase
MNPATTRPLCAITGTGGYLGGQLRRHFESHGWAVRELTRQPQASASARAFQLGTELAPGTLSGVRALIHCAYDFQALTRDEIHRTNVLGTAKLLHAARAASVARVACISSISAFAGCRSLYGQAKLEIERLAADHGALAIRPGLIYGEQPGGMFGRLVTQVSQASVLPLIGGGRQIQFLVHADDLSAFLRQFAERSDAAPGPPLTAAHAQPWTFRGLLEEIARARKKRLKFVPVPWRLVWLALKTAERLGRPLGFRSDSLVSLLHPNPQPDFATSAAAGLVCRPFRMAELP